MCRQVQKVNIVFKFLVYLDSMKLIFSSIPYKKSKLEEEKVVEVFREGVKPSESKSFVENLSLPDGLSNTNDSYCGIIQVTYYLIVEPEAIGCHYGFKICMPIIIGSVPLNFHENDQNHSTFDMRTDREDSAAQNVLVRCPSLSSLSPNNEVSDFRKFNFYLV